jgi:hypothetical protein
MSVKPVVNELAVSNPFLSEEEKKAVLEKQAVLDELLDQHGLAKYKIEILFGKGFAPSKPSVGAVSFWESGSKFHGGGDTILHMCPGKAKQINDCDAFIPDPSHGYGFLVCPSCHTTWKGEDVWGQILARLTVQGWAELVLKYFMKLEMKADIVIKYHPDDLRNAAMKEQEKQRLGQDLDRVRTRRVARVYPLRNIIKDTSAGAELINRFTAFIRA